MILNLTLKDNDKIKIRVYRIRYVIKIVVTCLKKTR